MSDFAWIDPKDPNVHEFLTQYAGQGIGFASDVADSIQRQARRMDLEQTQDATIDRLARALDEAHATIRALSRPNLPTMSGTKITTDCRVPLNGWLNPGSGVGPHTCTETKPCDMRP
jgi:hypothetical protein